MSRKPTALEVAAMVALSVWVAVVATTGEATGPGRDAGRPAYAAEIGDEPSSVANREYAETARRTGSVVPEEPLEVRLPSGSRVRVVGVSSDASRELAVPDDLGLAGWWRGGSKVGDPFGSTLVASHVDSSTQGLGPFAELLSVRRGARLLVSARHLVQVFRVTSLRTVARSTRIPDWIYSSDGPRRLILVTCAPPYDATRGGYQNLAVVVAFPVAQAASRWRTDDAN